MNWIGWTCYARMNNVKWKICVQFILYGLVKGFPAAREIQLNFKFSREARKVIFNWKNIKIMKWKSICQRDRICILSSVIIHRWPESDIYFNCEMAMNTLRADLSQLHFNQFRFSLSFPFSNRQQDINEQWPIELCCALLSLSLFKIRPRHLRMRRVDHFIQL